MPTYDELAKSGETTYARPLAAERWNASTHALGFALSIVGTLYLLRAAQASSLGIWLACLAYSMALMATYGVSALSHAVTRPGLKHRLRILDQGVIYLLIAGTYTPLVWSCMTWQIRWPALTIVWLAAWLGAYFKIVAQRRVIDFSARTYLWLGWIPGLALLAFAPPICRGWVILGGLCYTCGTYFLMRDSRRYYYHAIWHVWVILGSVCHYLAVYRVITASPE